MYRLRLPMFHSLLANIRYLILRIFVIFIHPSLTIITILKIRNNLFIWATTWKYFLPPFLISFIISSYCYFLFMYFWIFWISLLGIFLIVTVWGLYFMVIFIFFFNIFSISALIDAFLYVHVLEAVWTDLGMCHCFLINVLLLF
jgi:hypothetical protein